MQKIGQISLVGMSASAGAKDENRRIQLLIVDDDEKFLSTISERLGLSDFDVTTASDGKQAIKAAKGGEFDVVLLDLKMPGLDGTEVLKKLKKNHKFLEVIILTGHGSIDSAVECTKLGAFGYLEKPYRSEALLEILKQAYKNRLKRKFEHDQKRMEEIEMLSMGDPLSVLRSLVRIDDDQK